MRQGRRTAAAPPGIGTASRCPARSNPARSATRNSPPHSVPSVPYPSPSKATPITGPAWPLSAMHDAMCAWWCCTPTGSTPSRSSAYLVERYSGCRSWATSSGLMPNSRSK